MMALVKTHYSAHSPAIPHASHLTVVRGANMGNAPAQPSVPHLKLTGDTTLLTAYCDGALCFCCCC
jgi:hypothetical protein